MSERAGILAAAQSDDKLAAQELVRAVVEEGTQAISNARGTISDQPEGLKSIFERRFATSQIGQILLGELWDTASSSERAQFVVAFGDYLADTLISRFPDGTFTVFDAEIDVEANPHALTVRTVFATASSSHVIDWRVDSRDGEARILDVLIGGSSLIAGKQADITAFIDTNGGSVSAVIASLAD